MVFRKLFKFFDNIVNELDEQSYFPFNRSFRYGDAIFETVRIQNREILFFNDHISRLKKGILTLKFDVDTINLKSQFEEIIFGILKKFPLQDNFKIRIQLFREGEGLYVPNGNRPIVLVEAYFVDHDFELFNTEKKINVGVSKESFISNTIFSGLKTSNALPYVIAGIEKNERNVDDLIILNDKGFISECISSNIFWVDQNEIFTPALSCGCLEGVMRKNIISILDENHFEVNEVKQNFSLIKLNDAIFFTSNVFGIKIISSIDDFYNLDTNKFEIFVKSDIYKLLSSIQ